MEPRAGLDILEMGKIASFFRDSKPGHIKSNGISKGDLLLIAVSTTDVLPPTARTVGLWVRLPVSAWMLFVRISYVARPSDTALFIKQAVSFLAACFGLIMPS